MSDKPSLVKPPEKQPGWFDLAVARLAGFASLAGIIFAMGYLIFPLAVSQDGSCNYQGDIQIHPQFQPVFEANCLVMGPPISYIDTVEIDGYGEKTIQYFEGALLMGASASSSQSSQEVEIYPLGKTLEPKGLEQQLEQFDDEKLDTSQFYDYLAEIGSDKFLGQPVTDFLQIGDRLVVYFENTSLRWHPYSQTLSHQSLGRDHLLKHYPELLVDGEITQLFIPETPLRFIPGNALLQAVEATDYTVDVSVKYPVLYSDEQQVVTVEVIDRITNEPVTGLTIDGLAKFADLDNSDFDNAEFVFEPTSTAGTYVATISLPDHPNGTAGREVIINVSVNGIDTEKTPAIKKFQTWW